MALIITDECINCDVCEPECPADAIRPDTEPDMAKWVEFNRKYAELWPVIVTRKEPLPGAEEMDGKPGKMELLSEAGTVLRAAARALPWLAAYVGLILVLMLAWCTLRPRAARA